MRRPRLPYDTQPEFLRRVRKFLGIEDLGAKRRLFRSAALRHVIAGDTIRLDHEPPGSKTDC